jgi:hypothetical protein
MKPTNEFNDDPSLSDTAIEAALRRLPPVTMPRGLEERVVAAIPRVLPVVQRSASASKLRERQWFGLAAVAAAMVLVVVSVASWHGNRRSNSTIGPPRPEGRMIVVTFVQTKETDPCNILPPLADWR